MEGDLTRAWKRSKKKRGWDDESGISNDMKDVMIRLSPVPREMAEEVADFFLSAPVDDESVYKAEEILELLNGDWRPEQSALERDDWEFIKEQVNAWALEMDMNIVTDVMRVVVDRGGFFDT